jgi:hypothetical protein
MSRRKKGLSGRTTRHAKLSKPIKDCNSLNLSFFLCLADASTLLTLSIFSCGSLDKFLTLCSKLGVPIKAEKTVQPTTVITIYGIEVDSCNMECRLPQEKIDKVKKVLASAKSALASQFNFTK